MSANNEDLKKVTQRRRPHGPGARMMPGEKAKDFKGSIGKLVRFMGQFKAALVLAIISVSYTHLDVYKRQHLRSLAAP